MNLKNAFQIRETWKQRWKSEGSQHETSVLVREGCGARGLKVYSTNKPHRLLESNVNKYLKNIHTYIIIPAKTPDSINNFYVIKAENSVTPKV